MPVRQIVNDDKIGITGVEISQKEFLKLKQNYVDQKRVAFQGVLPVLDSLEAWVSLDDIIELVNRKFQGALTLNPIFNDIGIKIFYGAHGDDISEIKIADTKYDKSLYRGLHTVILGLTKDYDPNKTSEEIARLHITPQVFINADDSLVDGVHLCEPNCP